EELFGLVKKTPPDLLILDYDQVHNLLKIHLELLVREFPASRILMISSNIQHENVSMILQLGITHFIHKRCNKDELFTAIKAAFRNENYYCRDIVKYLMKDDPCGSKKRSDEPYLTKKEIEITSLIAQGLTTKEIASKLFLSVHTVNTHRKNILKKLGINSSGELIMYAIHSGIIDTTEYYI
ncbi:MAG: response regulator transcription factor, partial [Bacteroidota bacterium]|nr:response regulator transcription factor [Bacteroidota bacterium]